MSVLVAACVIAEVPASTPVTVNDCATFQFEVVNVSAPETVALVAVPLVAVTTTCAVGCVSSTAVYCAVAPSATETVFVDSVTPGEVAAAGVPVSDAVQSP